MDNKTEIKTNISAPILVGNGESIEKKLTELINDIRNVPHIKVEHLDINIQVNREYRYVD